MLTLCRTTYPTCSERLYELVVIRLPEDTWKLSYLMDKRAARYLHLVRTLVVHGTCDEKSQYALHIMCTVLQRLDGLRTLIAPGTTGSDKHLLKAMQDHAIIIPRIGVYTIIRPKHILTAFPVIPATFLAKMQHLTIQTPLAAISMLPRRHLQSLTITAQFTISQLQIQLIPALIQHDTVKYLGLTVAENMTPTEVLECVLPAMSKLQIISITRGFSNSKVCIIQTPSDDTTYDGTFKEILGYLAVFPDTVTCLEKIYIAPLSRLSPLGSDLDRNISILRSHYNLLDRVGTKLPYLQLVRFGTLEWRMFDGKWTPIPQVNTLGWWRLMFLGDARSNKDTSIVSLEMAKRWGH